MAYYLKDLPFTEEGKKLKLSDEDRKRFRLVYKKNGEDWTLHDIWGEGGDYGDDCIVVPLESTYAGWTDLGQNVAFRNVVGSTKDPKPIYNTIQYQSWYRLWEAVYRDNHDNNDPPRVCCTDGNAYISSDSYDAKDCYVNCTTDLVGGHVVLAGENVKPTENARVYIVPICRPHNNVQSNRYMLTKEETFAVILNYWVKSYKHYDYFAQRPLETHEKI